MFTIFAFLKELASRPKLCDLITRGETPRERNTDIAEVPEVTAVTPAAVADTAAVAVEHTAAGKSRLEHTHGSRGNDIRRRIRQLSADV